MISSGSKRFLAVFLGIAAIVLVVWELVWALPPDFQGLNLWREFMMAETAEPGTLASHAGLAALGNGNWELAQSAEELAPERRAEYFHLIRLFMVLLAAVMLLAGLVCGAWARGRAVPLTRLRYEKILLFGSLLPLVIGGVIMYFNLFGSTDLGLRNNWSRFLVDLTLLSCSMLYIALAMTRKYVNRYCHKMQLAVPPFQRWPGFLNLGTLGILLVAALLPGSWLWAHLAALGWVVLTAGIYAVREVRYLRELTKYVSYYRYAAGTAYLTLCVSSLGVAGIGVPLWRYLEHYELKQDRTVLVEMKTASEVLQP